jgi:hypothetical protein
MSDDMKRDAVISDCGLYRYLLKRVWDASLPGLVFIMLNPSKADAKIDDPTILACIAIARAQGCGGIVVVNLFAYRATSPADMKAAADPVGPKCNKYIVCALKTKPKMVIAAWGADGWYRNRCVDVRAFVTIRYSTSLHCLGTTKDGSPKHPLARGKHRIPPTFEPQVWREAA